MVKFAMLVMAVLVVLLAVSIFFKIVGAMLALLKTAVLIALVICIGYWCYRKLSGGR